MKNLSLSVALCVLLWTNVGSTSAQLSGQNHLPTDAGHTPVPAAAQGAVEVWLGLADEAQYDKAWQATSSLFRKTVTQERWTNLAKSHRTPLGKVLSRKLTSATSSKTLPAAPEGQYAVIEYTTSFEHKQTARETATAMLDTDGVWRVSGYFVR